MLSVTFCCFSGEYLDAWERVDTIENREGLKRYLRCMRVLLAVFFPVFIVILGAIPVQLCEVDMTNWLTRIGWLEVFASWYGIYKVNQQLRRIVHIDATDYGRVFQEDGDDFDDGYEHDNAIDNSPSQEMIEAGNSASNGLLVV